MLRDNVVLATQFDVLPRSAAIGGPVPGAGWGRGDIGSTRRDSHEPAVRLGAACGARCGGERLFGLGRVGERA